MPATAIPPFWLLFLLVSASSAPDTTVCPVGFCITAVHFCDTSLGPCKTTNYDASVPTFANTCLSCFDDAQLFTAYKFGAYGATCVPKVCSDVLLMGSSWPGVCRECLTGFSLTANRSCVVNAGIVVQPTATSTSMSNTNTVSSASGGNANNSSSGSNSTANATNPSSPTPPSNSSSSATSPGISSSGTSTLSTNLSSSSQDNVTASIILSCGAVLCMLLWIAFKAIEYLKFRPAHLPVLPEGSFAQEEAKMTQGQSKERLSIAETKDVRRNRRRVRAEKEGGYDRQEISFTEVDEIVPK